MWQKADLSDFGCLWIREAGLCISVCRRAYLYAQYVEFWIRWTTTAEDHNVWQSCQLGQETGNWRANKGSKSDNKRFEKCCLVDFCCHILTVGSEFDLNAFMIQAGWSDVMAWGIFSWNTLSSLALTEHHLSTITFLRIVAEHVCYDPVLLGDREDSINETLTREIS